MIARLFLIGLSFLFSLQGAVGYTEGNSVEETEVVAAIRFTTCVAPTNHQSKERQFTSLPFAYAPGPRDSAPAQAMVVLSQTQLYLKYRSLLI
ncbi:MAG: hypothetical protein OEV74_05645 [Cyclobacteriaceae bacterium]|jgi:hypothetical protein|nr:hypothetical protein [Cyclobacteriaceae bacterium]MDH4295745.1 hypothetical protein [Cyclobacteriaceae bacterium]MDH5249571.1 hypothetical protein [Cyclobacteriaceae bacterium]